MARYDDEKDNPPLIYWILVTGCLGAILGAILGGIFVFLALLTWSKDDDFGPLILPVLMVAGIFVGAFAGFLCGMLSPVIAALFLGRAKL